jgi:hypothetical protein
MATDRGAVPPRFTVVYSDQERGHNPPFEVHDGGIVQKPFETSARVEIIQAKLQDLAAHGRIAGLEVLPPHDFGLTPLLAVHSADYLEFLRTAWDDWVTSGGKEVFCQQSSQVLLASTYATFFSFFLLSPPLLFISIAFRSTRSHSVQLDRILFISIILYLSAVLFFWRKVTHQLFAALLFPPMLTDKMGDQRCHTVGIR